MKTKLIILTIVLQSLIANAQSNFHKLYTLTSGQCRYITMTATENGNALFAYQHVNGSNEWLAFQSVDTMGNTVFTKVYQPPGASLRPVSIAATPGNGAVVMLLDTNQMTEVQMVKIDQSGSIQWARSFSAQYFITYGIPLTVMADGSIYLAHASSDSLFLTKISASGTVLWDKHYNGQGFSSVYPSAILYHDSDNALYIAGYDNDSYTAYLIKTDTTGSILWQKRGLGISASLNLTPCTGGGVILQTFYSNAFHEITMGRIDAGGQPGGWGLRLAMPEARMMRLTGANIGLASQKDGIIKLAVIDTLGTLKDVVSYHDSITTYDFTAGAATGKHFWLAGVNNDKIWLMKSGVAGNSDCFMQPDTLLVHADTLSPADLNYITTTHTTTLSNISFSPQNISLNDSVICGTVSVSALQQREFSIYPNPTHEDITISSPAYNEQIVISDVFGRTVYQCHLSGKVNINTSAWQPGIYFVNAHSTGHNTRSYKIIKY